MKLIAFDIGTYSIKFIEFEQTFGRFELIDYVIEKVFEPANFEKVEETTSEQPTTETEPKNHNPILSIGQLQAIQKILQTRPLKYDRLIVNLPKSWSTSRLFHFPTKDRKAIQNSLNFELDDEIPFPLEKVVFDFAILNTENINSTVYAAVALKDDLSDLISQLLTVGLNPDMITTDSWAFGQVLRRALPKEYENQPTCIVNIGSQVTEIHIYIGHTPILSHISSCSGNDITKAIAKAYSLSFDDAEKAKVDGGFLITKTHHESGEQLTEEQIEFSNTIAKAIEPLIREIKQCFIAYKTQYKLTPKAMFTTGGSSLLPNLNLFLEEHVKIPVFPFQYISRVVGQSLQLADANEAVLSSATGLMLSMAKIERNYLINFRKDQFVKKGGISGSVNLKEFKQPLRYLAATLAVIYVNLFAQWILLSNKLEKQDLQFEKAVQSVLGPIRPTVLSTYKRSPSTLKAAVDKELAKFKELTPVSPTTPQISAYQILNKVSAAMPKDMTLDVKTFEVKNGNFRLEGVVDKIINSSRIIKALEETKVITNINKTKEQEDAKTHKVNFEFTAKVATNADVK